MEKNETVIDKLNFNEYFRDVRTSRPQKGDIMACFTAVAEFVDGIGKKDIIDLLKRDKAQQAALVMRKIHGAREPDCYRVCREIAQDLLTMPEIDVERKPYEYIVQYFYYTKREYVPTNNKHWSTISLLEWDADAGSYRSRIEI